jgi:hypothetical protein
MAALLASRAHSEGARLAGFAGQCKLKARFMPIHPALAGAAPAMAAPVLRHGRGLRLC